MDKAKSFIKESNALYDGQFLTLTGRLAKSENFIYC